MPLNPQGRQLHRENYDPREYTSMRQLLRDFLWMHDGYLTIDDITAFCYGAMNWEAYMIPILGELGLEVEMDPDGDFLFLDKRGRVSLYALRGRAEIKYSEDELYKMIGRWASEKDGIW